MERARRGTTRWRSNNEWGGGAGLIPAWVGGPDRRGEEAAAAEASGRRRSRARAGGAQAEERWSPAVALGRPLMAGGGEAAGTRRVGSAEWRRSAGAGLR